MYVPPSVFRRRLQMLAEDGYTVLPLHEALERLARRDLPPRSVAITFDDGFYDFYLHAAPVLKEFGFPATVYLPTYYVDKQTPLFNLAISYLLWKNRGPGKSLEDGSPLVTTEDASLARTNFMKLLTREVPHAEKQERVQALAAELGSDYPSFLQQRILQLMNAREIEELSRGRVTFEAHTHRHYTPLDPEAMRAELRENMDRVEEITGRRPRHFCFPSGNHLRDHFPVLEQEGLLSAVTCQAGIASRASERFLLPRVLDHAGLTDLQYEGWISGFYALGQRLLTARV